MFVGHTIKVCRSQNSMKPFFLYTNRLPMCFCLSHQQSWYPSSHPNTDTVSSAKALYIAIAPVIAMAISYFLNGKSFWSHFKVESYAMVSAISSAYLDISACKYRCHMERLHSEARWRCMPLLCLCQVQSTTSFNYNWNFQSVQLANLYSYGTLAFCSFEGRSSHWP